MKLILPVRLLSCPVRLHYVGRTGSPHGVGAARSRFPWLFDLTAPHASAIVRVDDAEMTGVAEK